ncbi:MAG TPA: glycosyl hydrolase family 65 protein, partial [Gemmatimonadaceae bacterium]|nr:glycosyl hydrolase family 65 protein [Gemmatimonadaceae bacterium]
RRRPERTLGQQMKHGALTIEPWSVTERGLHLDLLPQTESLFALSNGHIGLRGNLDEGEPHGMPGTYLNGYFEILPLPHAEAGYGYPEESQSLIDVTNGKIMRLLVDDEPFDIRYGTLTRHERVLDLRDGVLRRDVDWTSPAGQRVRVRTTRLVSFVQRSIAAIRYEVTALEQGARIVLQSSLVANEPLPERLRDPRNAAALASPLVSEYHADDALDVSLGHHARASGLRVAAGLSHLIDASQDVATSSESEPDLARVSFSTELAPDETVTVVKLLAYGWSSQRSMPSLRDQVDAALHAARTTGWDRLATGQRAFLDDMWRRADIEIDGDPELQQAARFAIFHVMQSAARAEKRGIPAKGLTGRGYDGHTFWDMDSYTLPVLTYIAPDAARDAIEWRHTTLPMAKARAHELGLSGAAFPWRTIEGQECSGYWPASTAAFHVTGGIAEAVRRYVAATDDREFEQTIGLELLVETARLWIALGHYDAEGGFRIDGVTGPDEYSALGDNNTFTNLMAARNLSHAAAAAERHRDRAADFDVDEDEVARWRAAADAIVVPFDTEVGVTAQCDGFTRYRRWDFAADPAGDEVLLMRYPYYRLYSSQVVKQADLVFALYLFGDRFSDEQKRRDFEYYEPMTVRDSSLSAPIQAIVAAEVGHLDLAYDYVKEAALIDLRDLSRNTSDGIHLAALSGVWLGVVAGFAGMRDHGDTLSFAPRLPRALKGISFQMMYRGRRIRIELTQDAARYVLVEGDPLAVSHDGSPFELSVDTPVTLACPEPVALEPVSPPPGREAVRGAAAKIDGSPASRPVPHRKRDAADRIP